MIVVDSSVWIDQLRGDQTRAVRKLEQVEDLYDTVLVGDLVLLEVLRGARSEVHAAQLQQRLRRFQIVSMLDDNIAVKAAGNYRVLRSRGITIRRTPDLIIATFCAEHGHELLHGDRDFDPLAEYLGLRVI